MKKKIIPIEIENFKNMTLRQIFPTEPCSRCGGSGKYSFNLIDLDLCYGCNGTGWKYTRAGKKMMEAFKDAQMKDAADVKIGDKVDLSGRGNFVTVTEIFPAKWQVGKIAHGVTSWYDVSGFTFVSKNSSLTTASKLRVARSLEENYDIYLKVIGAK